MKNVFVTIFDEGRKQVWRLDPGTLEFLGGEHVDPARDRITAWKHGAGYYGTIYNNEFYLTEEDAWRAWNRDGWPKSYTLQEIRKNWGVKSPRMKMTA